MIGKITGWNFHNILEYMVYKGFSESDGIELITEYEKYIVLASSSKNEKLGMTGLIDEVWHVHILHTKDYRSFCNKIAGGYIDHTPSLPIHSTIKLSDSIKNYENTLHYMRAKYGELNRNIWPDTGCTYCDKGTDIQKVGVSNQQIYCDNGGSNKGIERQRSNGASKITKELVYCDNEIDNEIDDKREKGIEMAI